MTTIDEFYRLEPSRYTILNKLVIVQNEHNVLIRGPIDISLELLPEKKDCHKVLVVEFFGAQELRIQNTTGRFQITGLVINSLIDRQWDLVGYSVSDVEDEVISFSCKSFEAGLKDMY